MAGEIQPPAGAAHGLAEFPRGFSDADDEHAAQRAGGAVEARRHLERHDAAGDEQRDVADQERADHAAAEERLFGEERRRADGQRADGHRRRHPQEAVARPLDRREVVAAEEPEQDPPERNADDEDPEILGNREDGLQAEPALGQEARAVIGAEESGHGRGGVRDGDGGLKGACALSKHSGLPGLSRRTNGVRRLSDGQGEFFRRTRIASVPVLSLAGLR